MDDRSLNIMLAAYEARIKALTDVLTEQQLVRYQASISDSKKKATERFGVLTEKEQAAFNDFWPI